MRTNEAVIVGGFLIVLFFLLSQVAVAEYKIVHGFGSDENREKALLIAKFDAIKNARGEHLTRLEASRVGIFTTSDDVSDTNKVGRAFEES